MGQAGFFTGVRWAAFVKDWRARHPRLSLYLLAAAIHLAIAPFLIHDWDGYVFIKTADDFLHGLSPYQAVENAPSYIFIGDGVPVVNSWYAYPPVALLLMTPFYAAAQFLLGDAAWVARLGIKFPLILGDLALAFFAVGFVRASIADRVRAETRATLVERLILFNPFLIFVSAAWGMFDAWMMAFVVATAWAIVRGRFALGGVTFALACLVKPFPVFIGPIFLVYIWHVGRARAAFRWVGAGVVAGAAVVLPFFLDAPQGFLQQVLYNHLGRPPQGFTLAGIPLAFGWINGILGTSLPAHVTPETISQWAFFALVLVLGAIWIQGGTMRTPRDLIHMSLVGLTGVLLVSKVVNEQYFVMPVALATVAYALSDDRLHRWLMRAFTIGGIVSGVLLGYHFLTFIPVDVAEVIFPFEPTSAAPRLTNAIGLNSDQAYVYPTLIAAASLVPALLIGTWVVGRQAFAPFRALRGFTFAKPVIPPATAALLVLLLLVAPGAAAFLTLHPADDPQHGYVVPQQPLVGAYYYLWWNNPSHDPDIVYGNWREGTAQVPVEGYYTTTAGKMRNDFATMKASGIDLVVYPYHGYDRPKLPAVMRLALDTGVVTAPMFELSDLIARPELRPRDAAGEATPVEWGLSLRNDSRAAVVEFVAGPLGEFSHFSSWLRVDGEPVVFLHGANLGFPDAEGEVRTRFIDTAMTISTDDVAAGRAFSTPTREALAQSVPASPEELRQPDADLWRRAWHELYRSFWNDVNDDLNARFGNVTLIRSMSWDPDHGADRGASLAASAISVGPSFLATPSDSWVDHLGEGYDRQFVRWDTIVALHAQHARGADQPVIVSVTPGRDDRNVRGAEGWVLPYEDNGTFTYARMWETALAVSPDIVIIDSWNNFRLGNAIEPTVEWGVQLVDETKSFAAARVDRVALPPDVLLITNLLGATYQNASGDPDGSFEFSTRLERSAAAVLGTRVAAVEWNGPALGATNFSDYSLIIVEPGARTALTSNASALPPRLLAYAESGGRILLMGSDVGPDFARLANWTEPPFDATRLTLLTPRGDFTLPVTAWTKHHDIPVDASVLLWMTDGKERMPAVWDIAQGNGTIAVTAFRPQGTTKDSPILPAVFVAVLQAVFGERP